MAVKKINYNSKIAYCMHRPTTNGADKYVLYPKNKDYTGAVEGNTKAEQDPEYLKLSEVYANSPTNIRQVFITGKRVYTYLYSGIQVPANRNTETVFKKMYDDGNLDMFEVAKKILEYEAFRSNPSLQATASLVKGSEPDRYIVEGNILGAITHPYTCNNIEEIYLDWTIFLSNDPVLKGYFPNFVGPGAINTFLSNNYEAMEEDYSNQIQSWFTQTCMGAAKNIRSRFPRLKMIAIVSRLDDLIMYNGNIPMIHTLDTEFDSDNKDKSGKTWYELNRQRIQQSQSLCFVCRIPGSDKTIFEVKDQQYKFDREVLKVKVHTFLEKLKDADRKARYGSTLDTSEDMSNKEDKPIGNSEQYLLDLEAKYGLDYVGDILAIAAIGETKTSLLEFFADFTRENRTRFASKIGLKL